MEVYQTALGVGLGAVVDGVHAALGNAGFKNPAPNVELYHFGLLSFIVAARVPALRWIGLGFGTALIVEEFFEANPFGAFSPPNVLSGNIGLTTFLGGFVVAEAAR